jgi:tetratricopeptide (TPR) repeat protein
MKGTGALALVMVSLGVVALPAAASAQSATAYAQNPADVLASNVRLLATDPTNFQALVTAGRAALETGDPEAAASFFGRAQEANPNSYLPPAGMGAALVAAGKATEALPYFTRAQQLGASVASIGADLGLAYDLMGQQALAQSDYRAALSGPNPDDARRRLALSLAISGQQAQALAMLQPLLMRSDPAAKRGRAFILALGGNIGEAETALNFVMPGASARMDPFFRRLAALSPAQKAAAVHLGIFPENDVASYASASPSAPSPPVASTSSGDRLASIDQLLQHTPAPAANSVQQAYTPAVISSQSQTDDSAPARYSPPVQVASISRTQIQQVRDSNSPVQIARVAGDPNARKIWLQLASGNAAAFPDQFRRIKSKDPSLFSGISGYVADDGQKARLVIGPFHSGDDARLFAEALSGDDIASYNWTSDPDQPVTRLPGQ